MKICRLAGYAFSFLSFSLVYGQADHEENDFEYKSLYESDFPFLDLEASDQELAQASSLEPVVEKAPAAQKQAAAVKLIQEERIASTPEEARVEGKSIAKQVALASKNTPAPKQPANSPAPQKEGCSGWTCDLYRHSSRFSVEGIVGKGYGYDTRRATADLFLAPTSGCNKWQPFLDVEGHYLEGDHWAANAGLGLRRLHAKRVWGVNAFYDFREGKIRHYNQVGVGLESLGRCWDFRINGYLPVGDKKHFSSAKVFDDFIGSFVMSCREQEYALKGFDAEVGRYLYEWKKVVLYAALGPYYFDHKSCRHFWGGEARVKAQYSEYVSAEFRISYDQRFHTKTQGILTLSIPFNAFTKACQMASDLCRGLLWQPVVRKEIVVLNRDTCWEWNFD